MRLRVAVEMKYRKGNEVAYKQATAIVAKSEIRGVEVVGTLELCIESRGYWGREAELRRDVT